MYVYSPTYHPKQRRTKAVTVRSSAADTGTPTASSLGHLMRMMGWGMAMKTMMRTADEVVEEKEVVMPTIFTPSLMALSGGVQISLLGDDKDG